MEARDRNHKRAADEAARVPADTSPEPMAVDPTLVEDLGAEFEMRGDVLSDELESARSELAEVRDRHARLQAEWDNFRKRTAQEREDERARAASRLVEDILPALDDLDRALEHASEAVDVPSFAEGVAAVRSKLMDALARHAVETIDPAGQAFDAFKHQAVARVEDSSVEDETVVQTYQKGYEMGGRVLRPATVVVSTGGPRREGG